MWSTDLRKKTGRLKKSLEQGLVNQIAMCWGEGIPVKRQHIWVHKNKQTIEFKSERRERQGSDGHPDTLFHPTSEAGSLKDFK